jgi:16S rRNA processing protein RimM
VVSKAHGLRGELQVDTDPSTDDRIRSDLALRLVDGERSQVFRVGAVRSKGSALLLKLDGIDDRSAAESWARSVVLVDRDVLLAEADSYYDFELVGLRVIARDGAPMGTVREVIATGANDVLVVAGRKSEILVPAVASVLLDVDIESGHIRIDERSAVDQRGEEAK